ncbi:antitoxin [Corynebacterium xerosis]|uniref:Antitoxin n=1 Tax=Corynebacterium xerosis TaxID=1725 RepID=A0A2N6SYI2_9CORY|nr:antitoxin [Corynebacterium xerosis]
MSLIDKAKKFINDNPDKVRQGIDKIGDAIDKRTDGKYADKVDRVQEEAANRLGGDATPNTDAPKTEPKGWSRARGPS